MEISTYTRYQVKMGHHESSCGAQSTQRPAALPLAARSTILGWEHVTACVAVILARGQQV